MTDDIPARDRIEAVKVAGELEVLTGKLPSHLIRWPFLRLVSLLRWVAEDHRGDDDEL